MTVDCKKITIYIIVLKNGAEKEVEGKKGGRHYNMLLLYIEYGMPPM